MEAFGGVGVHATTPDELKRAVNAAMDSGKPTLINATIDPAAGSESGRLGNPHPPSVLKKKKPPSTHSFCTRSANTVRSKDDDKGAQGRSYPRFHPRPVGTDLHAIVGLVRRRRDQGRAPGRRR